jgi:hypothetical protein
VVVPDLAPAFLELGLDVVIFTFQVAKLLVLVGVLHCGRGNFFLDIVCA